MRISLIKKDKINGFILPVQIHGNYWITDIDSEGKERNLINIVEDKEGWKLISNFEVQVYDEGTYLEDVILKIGKFYILKEKDEEDVLLYCDEVYESKKYQLMLKNDADIMIGSSENCQICYKNSFVAKEHVKLIYKNSEWYLTALTTDHYVYVNNRRRINTKLLNGDIVFVMGLKLIILKNNIIINSLEGIKVDGDLFVSSKYPVQAIKEFEEDENKEINYYEDDDYFYRAPRFKNSIVKETMVIDPAPIKIQEDKTPMIFIIGPMLTMAMTSLITAYTSINSIITSDRSLSEALPSILMSVAMIITMILWPLLSKKYQNKQKIKKEKERQEKYSKYIEQKRSELKSIMKQQTEALIQSYPPLEELEKIILYKKNNLWEKEIEQDDFLNLRVGIGTRPVDIDIKYPEEHFSMDEDNLKDIQNKLVLDSKDLNNVPITISFTEKFISAIIGDNEVIKNLAYGLLLQIISSHSYDDLKIVMFTNEAKKDNWDFLKVLPHSWSNDKSTRYFASNLSDMKQVSSILENEFQSRAYEETSSGIVEKKSDYKSYKPYYFIIIDDFKTARDLEIVKNVLDKKINVGFSILILNDKFNNLPNQCMNFISIGQDNKSVIFEDELVINKQKKFIADNNPNLKMLDCSIKLANIPIDIENGEYLFPKIITFLEMYNVGKVEQLNSFNRWKVNSPINSLQAPVGVDSKGNLFELDIHEKFHGPHGLIAGMTGSGKSEFIITYVLSLAVNYHPDEVSFILIDYKGGGLAGAFSSKETGMKLPHLAGTITNLDTVEMKRSLVSIESELKRRQKMFNEAREKTGESTIDIYKYQKLYREGLVNEPISHLLIICDEFAELKVQQPDFMEQLISTARIGRSLGVHLILATQKPSGVVDDQIWSNSRFRVCLKVQEKSDSIDMLKSPDAAMIKDVGRFYLQVGYNEFYALGQSAWCGAQYYPTDKLKKKIDNSLSFVDDTGYVIKNIDDSKKIMNKKLGEELTNIVKYLSDIAIEEKINIEQLWLDRIPDLILVDDLAKKYNYIFKSYEINPIIGEYDDPSNQRQDLLTLNLSNDGNILIYGSAGSGKNILISSIVYSTIVNHTADEVNFYLLDFGSETLKVFLDAPQVGDVLLLSDEEKVTNLFRMLKTEILKRKKLLSGYNGNINFYNKKSEKKLPLIVTIINNYESFAENYEKFEEDLIQITRDGYRFGIVFILSTSGTNTTRYRVRQNFKQELVLQMNSESDYTSILGRLNGVYPSKAIGRGLLKKDKVYEFQSAHPFNPNIMLEEISSLCKKLKETSKQFANNVPTLPEIVKKKDINARLTGIDMVPLGINKLDLSVSSWNFKSNFGTMITGLDMKNIKFFLDPFIKQFEELDCTMFVLDASKIIDSPLYNSNIVYYNKDFEKMVLTLYMNIKQQYDAYVKSKYNKELLSKVKPGICTIIGLEDILNMLSEDTKNKFIEMIKLAEVIQTLRFILVDSIDVFKKLEYNNWYKMILDNSEGIWLGNGISEQYSIRLNKVTRELQKDVDKYFGYVIKRGNASLTKFLSSTEE